VWKLESPSTNYPTLYTAGHTADKLEITTWFKPTYAQGIKRGECGVYGISLDVHAVSGDAKLFGLSRWFFITRRLTTELEFEAIGTRRAT
jgi:hypothetical protein